MAISKKQKSSNTNNIQQLDLLHDILLTKLKPKMSKFGLTEQQQSRLVREVSELSEMVIDSFLSE